ncbi:ATPase [Marinilabiliaceae bacterium JC017]|nr:ATPase [Marinilabiliaceae bacterium JC017]
MKTKILSIVSLFLLGTVALWAQSKSEQFKVYGNCGMCEKRIETAAKSVDGVSAADWDKKTKVVVVTYDNAKTNVDAIHKAIAKVGHDTDMYKAEDDVYNKLPGCCKYDRPKTKSHSKEHKH